MFTFSAARLPTLSLTLALVVAAGTASAYADVFARPPAAPERLDARVAWEIHLPSAQVALFKSYHLLEGRIYAMGTDGTVVAVRADTGEVAWIRALADEGDALYPPVTYRSQEKDAVVFGRLNDVVLLDSRSGVPVDFLKLSKPSICGVTVAPGRVFVPQANGRLAAYRLRDGYIFWRAAFDEQFTVPPVYAPAINAVVAVDVVGLVAGLKNERTENRLLFRQNLRSKPTGALATDGDMLYLATENQTLHAIDMGRDEDSNAGDVVWQYRLAGSPEGGPILTDSAIYQAVRGGGLHRIAKHQGEFKNWYDPKGRQFLAEWPRGAVLLRTDGSLALIGDDPAHPLALGSAGGFATGLANSVNDAVFLTTPQGTIRCIRPADAAPMQLASFLPPPTTAPAEPDEPTEIDRLRESAQKKRDKLAGRTPPEEVEVEPAPEDEADEETEPTPEQPADPAEPYDPLKSKRPVVR